MTRGGTFGLAVGTLLLLACGSSGSGSSSTSGGASSTSSSSSGGSSGQCADCGGCGIAGPVNEDSVFVTQIGTDAAGVAAVGMDVYAAGECRGSSTKRFVLRYASGSTTLSPRQASETIATAGVTTNGDETVWTDRDLHLTTTKPSATVAKLSFRQGDAATATKDTTCTLAAGTLSCS